MPLDCRPVIAEAFPKLLAGFGMVFCEPSDPRDPAPPWEPALGARALFHGSHRGVFEILVPFSVASEIASNVLGIDVQEPAGMSSRDAVRELASVVSGHLASLLALPNSGCRPSVPEVRVLDADSWQSVLGADGTQVFMIDGRPMLVRLSVEGGSR